MWLKWMNGILPLTVAACAGQPSTPAPAPQACAETGTASWYRAAAAKRTSPDELTAAHRTLPLGTMVQVTALNTGRSVIVRVNDRGPFANGRIIDLSDAAARQLGMHHDGVTQVRLQVEDSTGSDCPLHEASLTTG